MKSSPEQAFQAQPRPLQVKRAYANPVQTGNLLLATLLALSFPLTHWLPQFWGWENGPLENVQVVILLADLLGAAMAAYRQRGSVAAPLWWVALPFWLVFMGRELAWGAAFLPAIGHNQWGPTISSSVLWFRPAVPWVCAALLLLCCYWMLRHRLWSRVLLRLHQERAWPVASLLLFVLAMVISTNAEGHGFVHLQDRFGTQVVVLEELVETWGFAALWLAQWVLIRHTAGWRTGL